MVRSGQHRRWAAAATACFAAGAAVAVGPVAAQTAPPAGPAARFPVLEIRVQGNTVLPPIVIEEAVYPHLGPGRTAADLEAARAALEKAYTDAGYATVSVELPEQRATNGIITVQVTERSVGRLRITGARYFLPNAVRAGAPSLAEGAVPNLPAIQRDIVALNTLPDRRVIPELRAGANAPNTVDVDLQVEDTFPLHGSLELNNRRSRGTSDLRLNGSLRYDNLWQRGDSATIGYTVAPQRRSDAEVFSASYLWRVPRSGASIIGNVIRSDSDVATVGGTNVIGRGTIAGIRGVLPLGGGGEGFSHSVAVGIDRKDFDENLTLGTVLQVPITYYPVSANYTASWFGERYNTDFNTTLTYAFRGLGSNTAEFEQKRAFASPQFSHLRAQLTHVQRFPNDIHLYGNIEGQFSPEPLISNEQFGGGGLDSVRGYNEVEVLADYGVTAQMEVRSPSFAPRLGRPFDELRVHGFVDAGSLGINRPLPEQRRGETLLSTGVGARVRLYERVNGSLEGAAVLIDGPDSRAGSFRALFRLWGEF